MTGILIVSSVVIYAFIGMVAGILVSKSSWEACDLIAGMFWPVALPVMAIFYVGLRMLGVAHDLVDLLLDSKNGTACRKAIDDGSEFFMSKDEEP